MPGFIDLSAHLSAPQGLTRLTNVRFFDSWAFLGLTSLKCTLILAGRPGGESEEGVHPLAGQGGVWAPMFMYRAKVTWVWCIAHVSTQDLGGSIYIDFCLPCQPKQSKHLGFGTLRSTFSEGALLTMSVVVFRVKVNAFPQNFGGSIYLDFCLPCQPKQSKHLGFGTLKSTFSDGALFTMSVVMYRAKVTWVWCFWQGVQP